MEYFDRFIFGIIYMSPYIMIVNVDSITKIKVHEVGILWEY